MLGRLLFAVLGIYTCFLTWGVLQERISTTPYRLTHSTSSASSSSRGAYFKHFIFLNLCQSLTACICSFIYLKFNGSWTGWPSLPLTLSYLKISISSTLASPFGYASLKHINFPTMILGKSCKLLPVMLMNMAFYRKRFETYKYVTVALITIGVSGFMWFEPNGRGEGKDNGSGGANSLWGIFLLLINLLIDGATNSWQDGIFEKYRVRGQQMMFFMNFFSSILLFAWLITPFTSELSSAISFIQSYPSFLIDLLLFSLTGSLGQTFIFYMIQHFGSLALVTTTVTRKLFTILLSLFWFNHHLTSGQWACVLVVFVALGIESFAKRKKKSA
jgi:UDP-galactose transporter B1